MKKQLQLFTVLTAFMSLAGIKAMAHDIEAVNGDGVTIYYTWINNNTELAVTYYGDYYPPSSSFRYKGNVVIPESVTYDGTSYNVAAIGEYAFEACNNLTVTIGSNITSIGKRAFYASDLTSLTIPNSVTSISTSAFEFCADLTSLFIPKSVVSIGEEAFSYCESLTSIVVDSDNPVYDSRDNCNAIINTSTNKLMFGCRNTAIPNSVTAIGNYAFNGRNGLTSIMIPDGVTSIGDGAFRGCRSLVSITIPNSVTFIGEDAFAGSGLSSVTIPDGVTAISNTMFAESGLTSIVIPDGVTSIGEGAFNGCSFLTSITIPDGVTCIGSYAFNRCRSLTAITIPNGVTSIGESTFWGCGLTAVVIPNSVTSIGNYSFQNCGSLTSITIGSNVASIGSYAFGYCTAMKELISHATTPPACESRVFDGIDKKNCTLYVPVGSSTAYHDADQWKDFSMEEKTFTGIDEKPVHQEATVRKCYTIGGIHTLQLQHGLSIVRMSDGTTKKVVRK
ncbi:MAG: leucine-rich repeat protein [Prevotella sp.]|nr:leucine-rich repeat protein [Prevotella sp.]